MSGDLLASVASDDALQFLRPALDSKSAGEIISKVLNCPAAVRNLRVIRHKPGRRCLIEYEIADPEPLTLIGKVRAKGANSATFDLLKNLRNAGFDDRAPDGIFVPEPIAVVPELRMILLRKEAGVPASELLTNHGAAAIAERMADVAYKLHRCGITPARTHDLNEELRILEERLGQAALIHPGWSERIARVVNKCRDLAKVAVNSHVTCIHRDFHPGQVLLDGTRCCLLDLDLFSLGDPALDVGNFIGHIAEFALREHGSAEVLAELEKAVAERYVQISGAARRVENIQVYRFLTIARHIFISTQFPERRKATDRLLEYCEQRL
jgi:hypothetical protein